MLAGSHSPRPRGAIRQRLRRAFLVLIGLLYVASVPWYRDPDAPLRIVLGLPDWVAVAIGCYAAAACLNAAAWWLRDDRKPGETGEDDERSAGDSARESAP